MQVGSSRFHFSRRESVFSSPPPSRVYFSLALLIFTLCGAVFAPIAWGAPTTIDVSSPPLSGPQTIPPGDYIITGMTTTGYIEISSSGTYNISFDNADIDAASAAFAAFDIVAGTGAIVNLTLVGTNSFKSYYTYAGIHVPPGATLNISGAGSLTATCSSFGAGIGGNQGEGGGTVTITGGTVTANGGGAGGAGIGGGSGGDGMVGTGSGGDGGTVTITGGTVTANGGAFGSAGIGGGGGGSGGGGFGGDGGTITISDQAIVTATRGSTYTYDIGPGSTTTSNPGAPATITITGGSVEATNNSISDTPVNASGTTLALVTFPLSGTATGSFDLTVGDSTNYNYPFTIPSTGTAYLWLPEISGNPTVIGRLNATADGSAGVVTSTLISFDFGGSTIASLLPTSITLTSDTGSADLGSTLSADASNVHWEINLDEVRTEGIMTFGVTVSPTPIPGYAFLPAPYTVSVDVYKGPDSSFIPVTNIIDVPTLTPERTPLTLSGTVEPSNATYKTIVWSVLNAGATGATVSGDTLNTRLSGTVNILATIISGLAVSPVSTDYKQSFDITVRPLTAPELIAESIRDNSGLDAIASGDVITVLGDQVGASTLTIDTTQSPGVRIQWNASYKGNLSLPLVIVRGNGVIELGVSANISNTMGSALTSEGDIIISGAVIEANGDYATAVFSEKNISMSSGSVFANGMDGMALFAAGNVTLTGGSLSATGERGLAVHALGTLTTNDSALITPSQAIKAEGGIVHIDSNNSKGSGGGCDVGFGAIALALALTVMARKK